MLFRNGSDKVKPVWQTDYRYVFRVSMKKSWVRKIQNKLSLNLCCLDCSPKSFNLSFNDRPTFDVVIYMAGYFDSNTWTLYLHSCSVSFGWLKKKRRFMTIIICYIQSSLQQSCITSFHVIAQCMVLHHHWESVDWLMGVRPSIASGCLRFP